MLSRRIADLFRLLQCGNTDIARYAHCSPSLISRLKSGLSEPGRSSRSVLRLAEGVYRYADYENMLEILRQLCNGEDTKPEVLIPAIVGWLYEEQDYVLPHTITPKSKRREEHRRHSFGARLDQVMTLLELTNGQLAAALNVDASLVSRYRSGIYHPNRNARMKERLSELLLRRAEKQGCSEALAQLCKADPADFSAAALEEWLCEGLENYEAGIAETLLRSIGTDTKKIPSAPPQLPPIREEPQYWGTEGLRSAVLRFLADAVQEGGELLLYSDEPMDWMSGDRDFFGLWVSLMAQCVQRGVAIQIIHNVDRIGPEMVSAIQGWFPLYMSGRIEPYLFRAPRNPRFYHTFFLRPGKAGILGFFPADAGELRWYDYVTDPKRLAALESGYGAMLLRASPLMRVYPLEKGDSFWQFCGEHFPPKWSSILDGLSFPTMPEGLLERMLLRTNIPGQQKQTLLAIYRTRRAQLQEMLSQGSVEEILSLPNRESVARGGVKINLGAELIDQAIPYTPEDYQEHLAAIRALVDREKNYHLTLLPHSPFQDMQVITLKDAVAVLRCREPYTAFVFLNRTLMHSVSDYSHSLLEQYAASRHTVNQALDELCRSLD